MRSPMSTERVESMAMALKEVAEGASDRLPEIIQYLQLIGTEKQSCKQGVRTLIEDSISIVTWQMSRQLLMTLWPRHTLMRSLWNSGHRVRLIFIGAVPNLLFLLPRLLEVSLHHAAQSRLSAQEHQLQERTRFLSFT